ncbi:hypothetical protein I7I53_11887 [Histoplasma capsulatum var. duboisii H88]|uniref:Uncharacterized protein n=1 Tax=Ajellomyces capsulatus (strain H88) TaxID=544711 RepID=A0A8A1LTW4_AJEC8|nr:hypothetical protein I7I53_11887 [Histoplasma capsulatum var. duboisii H88]
MFSFPLASLSASCQEVNNAGEPRNPVTTSQPPFHNRRIQEQRNRTNKSSRIWLPAVKLPQMPPELQIAESRKTEKRTRLQRESRKYRNSRQNNMKITGIQEGYISAA